MQVEFVRLDKNAIMPTYGTQYSAGADLYALPDGDITVKPGQTVLVHTGIAVSIPEGYGGFIFARSGIATKRGLAPANKVGVIDSDYRGEIMVSLYNHSSENQVVSSGERVAQMVIARHEQAEWVEVETLDETERGAGGYGHTGVK